VALGVHAVLKPFALTVVPVAIESGAVYRVDEVVGSVPSVVYRIVAPAVVVESATVWAVVYVP
jgi:hypothetical protein